MKAYGLPRIPDFENGSMDLADCLSRGAKSRCMKMSSKVRRSSRRIFKKSYRQQLRRELKVLED